MVFTNMLYFQVIAAKPMTSSPAQSNLSYARRNNLFGLADPRGTDPQLTHLPAPPPHGGGHDWAETQAQPRGEEAGEELRQVQETEAAVLTQTIERSQWLTVTSLSSY